MPRQGSGVRALTIHQAKNREFDRVVVLWGYTVPKEAEMRRRWLYNAITRARVAATVIVQGDKKRLKEAPFA
ncbi:MAG: ATP-binding domain-containing protein [Sandaracinaceae bacterium]|nr:ATP-binding domain-containing protein [Sandaracinaceae bacterium]